MQFFKKAKNEADRPKRPTFDKTYCIYHDKDFDGVLSAAIINREYPNTEFIPYDYGYDLNLSKIYPNSGVFIVDCSLPEWALKYLDEQTHLYLFDHHPRSLTNKVCKSLKGARESGSAACSILWDYLYPFGKIPAGIKLVNAFDIKDKQDKQVWNNEVLPFQAGLKQFKMDPASRIFEQVIESEREVIEQIIMEGQVIMRYEEAQAEIYMKKFSYDLMFNWDGNKVRALVVNRQMVGNEFFESAVDKKWHQMYIAYTRVNNVYMYSFRSWPGKGGVDVREIAEFFGGGGHKYAAGVTTDEFIL